MQKMTLPMMIPTRTHNALMTLVMAQSRMMTLLMTQLGMLMQGLRTNLRM